MTKEEFKRKWELDEGITFNDVADCAVKWIYQRKMGKKEHRR